LACAAALANLEVFASEDVFARIQAIAARHQLHLARIASHPSVAEARQIGTVAAIELKVHDPGYLSSLKPRLYRFFLEREILLRPLGHIIYVLPPYCIQGGELDRVYAVIEEALENVL
jgi:adenosylmethionine-8-amino-7-oxononanoate aminotransferase